MSVEDVTRFGPVVLLVSAAVLVALVGNRVSRLIRVPAPALFLVAAALASDLGPRSAGSVPTWTAGSSPWRW